MNKRLILKAKRKLIMKRRDELSQLLTKGANTLSNLMKKYHGGKIVGFVPKGFRGIGG